MAALLEQAARAWIDGDNPRALELAAQALAQDPSDIKAWRLLAGARERGGDFIGALNALEQAVERSPDQPSLLADLGRLALRMGAAALAESFYLRAVTLAPNDLEAIDGLARALKDQHRYEEAIALLQPAIQANPTEALLWNSLGTLVNQQGDSGRALIFFEEAVRLNPRLAQALYNRGGVRMDDDDAAAGLLDFDAALALVEDGPDAAMMAFARSTALLALGDLERGWDAYEARFDPQFAQYLAFDIDAPRWEPAFPLQGRSLLVVAEQGLGDETQFAGLIGDAAEAIGPEGRLILAVEPRLVGLFGRSFGSAEVLPYETRSEGARRIRSVPGQDRVRPPDMWTPLASLARRFRSDVSAFPDRAGYLQPDRARVAFWRDALDRAPPGLKVGITWRSGLLAGERRRLYASLTAWRPVLQSPGARFVNLQYGDCEAELDQVRREFGVEVWRPPGLDIREDLDDLAALCAALDLTIGCENATTHLAAACGAPTWIVSTSSWRRLGTTAYPWYPAARAFDVPTFDAWPSVLAEVASQLGVRIG